MMRRVLCLVMIVSALAACSKTRNESARQNTAAPSSEPPSEASAPRAEPPAPAAPTPKRPYNVLLLIMDAMRADMPWSGYPRDVVPWLNRFQSEHCVTYTQGYALSSYTAKSVVPMLVGKYASEMVRDGMFFTRWPDQDNVFVSERLQQAGHRTLSGQAHGYFLPMLGNTQGFDDARLIPGTVDLKAVTSVTDDKLMPLAKEMLSDPKNVGQDNGRRFFAYFHFMDPHHTYIKHSGHPDFGNKPRDLYDNELHWSDSLMGQLVDWARTQPWAENTAFVIAGDHGEGFGEHGHYRHAYELWESLVKVPMMFCLPGVPPRHVEVRRSQIDLAPTILDLMGVEAKEPPLRGTSLVPEIFGKDQAERPIVIDLPRSDLMDRRRALITGGYKIIAFGDDTRFELYHLNEDPWEKRELSKDEPAELERMKAAYAEISKSIPNVPIIGNAKLKGAPAGRRW